MMIRIHFRFQTRHILFVLIVVFSCLDHPVVSCHTNEARLCYLVTQSLLLEKEEAEGTAVAFLGTSVNL